MKTNRDDDNSKAGLILREADATTSDKAVSNPDFKVEIIVATGD